MGNKQRVSTEVEMEEGGRAALPILPKVIIHNQISSEGILYGLKFVDIHGGLHA
jgi:hypothetical protein